MNPAHRLANVHLALLALSIPLIILLILDGTEADSGTASTMWGYVGVTAVYVVVATTGMPMALFSALSRLGLARKTMRLLICAVALFSASGAMFAASGMSALLGVFTIAGALALFLWALALALFDSTPKA